MANRYWRGGNGVWSDTAHWSTSSGGAGGASVPGFSDDAFIDNNSGNPTVDFSGVGIYGANSLTVGDPANFNQNSAKTTILNFVNAGVGIGGGGLKIYGNVGFQTADYDDCYIQFSGGNPNFECYTNSTLPYITAGTNVTLTGWYYYIPRMRNFAGTFALTSSVSTFWFGMIDLRVSATLNFGGYSATCTGQIVDSTFAIAADTSPILQAGIVLSSSSQQVLGLGGDAFLTIGTKTDQYGNMWGGRAEVYLFEFGDVTAGGLTINNLNANYGRITITGNNTISQFSLGNYGARATFTGTNSFALVSGGNGEIRFPSGKTQTITAWSGYTESVRSSTPGSSATLNIGNIGSNNHAYFQDITIINSSLPKPTFVTRSSVDGGNNSGILFAQPFQKRYKYDVYDRDGTYVGTIPSNQIISEFGYSAEINNVAGELKIRRAVDPETVMYAGDSLCGYRFRIVVTCFSDFTAGGRTVYQGFISGWQPHLTGTDKYVDITVLSYGSELAQYLVVNDPVQDIGYTQSGTPLSFTAKKVAISFTTGSGVTNLAALDLSAFGVPPGSTVEGYLYKDNGSNTPDNTAYIARVTQTYFSSDNTDPYVYFSSYNQFQGATVVGSSKYWVVLTITDPTSGANFSNTNVFTTNSYGGGNFAYWNGSAWVQASNYGVASFHTYATNGATTVSYNTTVQAALENILQNYGLQGGELNTLPQYGRLEVNPYTDYPTMAFKYVFQSNTIQDALNQLVAQAGSDWYWYDDPAAMGIGFRRKSSGQINADDGVSFQMGSDLVAFDMEFTLEPVVNDLFIIGGDTGGGTNLFREYISTASIAQFGRRQKVITDSNLVDTSAADAIGVAYIQANGFNPTVRAPITLGDVYDYERLHVGMMFFIYNANVPNSYQVSRLDFSPATATVTAATVPTQVTNQTQQNTQQIAQIQGAGNPTAPVVINV